MTGFSGSLIVDAGTADEAHVTVHQTQDGLALAAVRIGDLTLQSGVRGPHHRGIPEGGPDVLADLLEALAARVRLAHAAWLLKSDEVASLVEVIEGRSDGDVDDEAQAAPPVPVAPALPPDDFPGPCSPTMNLLEIEAAQ